MGSQRLTAGYVAHIINSREKGKEITDDSNGGSKNR
jgi:hypothetical protein